jgi:acid phosphatase
MKALRAGLVLCWLAAPAIAGCAHAASSAPVGNLFDAQRQVEQYIVSGRYEADFAKVAREAQAYVERRATSATRPAIVLDIDETSLSNWPAYKANGWGRVVGGECNLDQGPCGIRAWQALGQSKAIAPTLALVTRAKALGVAVFFISGRPPLLEATERNLRDQGVWDGVIVLPEGELRKRCRFRLSGRRSPSGPTILVSMGDRQRIQAVTPSAVARSGVFCRSRPDDFDALALTFAQRVAPKKPEPPALMPVVQYGHPVVDELTRGSDIADTDDGDPKSPIESPDHRTAWPTHPRRHPPNTLTRERWEQESAGLAFRDPRVFDQIAKGRARSRCASFVQMPESVQRCIRSIGAHGQRFRRRHCGTSG